MEGKKILVKLVCYFAKRMPSKKAFWLTVFGAVQLGFAWFLFPVGLKIIWFGLPVVGDILQAMPYSGYALLSIQVIGGAIFTIWAMPCICRLMQLGWPEVFSDE